MGQVILRKTAEAKDAVKDARKMRQKCCPVSDPWRERCKVGRNMFGEMAHMKEIGTSRKIHKAPVKMQQGLILGHCAPTELQQRPRPTHLAISSGSRRRTCFLTSQGWCSGSEPSFSRLLRSKAKRCAASPPTVSRSSLAQIRPQVSSGTLSALYVKWLLDTCVMKATWLSAIPDSVLLQAADQRCPSDAFCTSHHLHGQKPLWQRLVGLGCRMLPTTVQGAIFAGVCVGRTSST